LPRLRDITLSVRGGEVFGIAGVDGNGQAELFDVLAGTRTPSHGRVVVSGTTVGQFDPAAMAAAGIGCVPPDRLRQGVVPAMSVRENAELHAVLLRRVSPGLLTRPSAERAFARQIVDAYAIRTSSLETPVRTLSGGNVQKLVVGRTLALEPNVLVAANPTRGLDVGAAEAVHAAIRAALIRGAGVLLISTDLDEILARAQRVAVLYRGGLSRVFARPFAAAELGALMAGSEAA
jgi:simple sugar transport system ATP-binding protein